MPYDLNSPINKQYLAGLFPFVVAQNSFFNQGTTANTNYIGDPSTGTVVIPDIDSEVNLTTNLAGNNIPIQWIRNQGQNIAVNNRYGFNVAIPLDDALVSPGMINQTIHSKAATAARVKDLTGLKAIESVNGFIVDDTINKDNFGEAMAAYGAKQLVAGGSEGLHMYIGHSPQSLVDLQSTKFFGDTTKREEALETGAIGYWFNRFNYNFLYAPDNVYCVFATRAAVVLPIHAEQPFQINNATGESGVVAARIMNAVYKYGFGLVKRHADTCFVIRYTIKAIPKLIPAGPGYYSLESIDFGSLKTIQPSEKIFAQTQLSGFTPMSYKFGDVIDLANNFHQLQVGVETVRVPAQLGDKVNVVLAFNAGTETDPIWTVKAFGIGKAEGL